MRTTQLTLAALVLGASLLGGCASGPYDAAGYTTVEKNGRILVFIPRSGAHQEFNKSGEMGKSVTRVAAGPVHKTVVASEGVDVDSYIAAAKEKYDGAAAAK
jgi:esterase/lipase superfamily enzyme